MYRLQVWARIPEISYLSRAPVVTLTYSKFVNHLTWVIPRCLHFEELRLSGGSGEGKTLDVKKARSLRLLQAFRQARSNENVDGQQRRLEKKTTSGEHHQHSIERIYLVTGSEGWGAGEARMTTRFWALGRTGTDLTHTRKLLTSILVFSLSQIHTNQFTWVWSLQGKSSKRIFHTFQMTANIYYPCTGHKHYCPALQSHVSLTAGSNLCARHCVLCFTFMTSVNSQTILSDCYYCPHNIDEKTETQKNKVTLPRSLRKTHSNIQS